MRENYKQLQPEKVHGSDKSIHVASGKLRRARKYNKMNKTNLLKVKKKVKLSTEA